MWATNLPPLRMAGISPEELGSDQGVSGVGWD